MEEALTNAQHCGVLTVIADECQHGAYLIRPYLHMLNCIRLLVVELHTMHDESLYTSPYCSLWCNSIGIGNILCKKMRNAKIIVCIVMENRPLRRKEDFPNLFDGQGEAPSCKEELARSGLAVVLSLR
uniref:CASPASE_P20 domain-containing protein n=1 Tax=Steinernema glaseri TaxID=37863 RepID=A0A1I7Z3K5_9BILA